MIFQDLSGFDQWVCSFDDLGLTQHFRGYDDKVIVGVGYNMNKFFNINDVVSGKTILVMNGAEVLDGKIMIGIDQVVALEEDQSLEHQRLKYLPTTSISKAPVSRLLSPSTSLDSSNLRGGKPIMTVGAPDTKVYNIPLVKNKSDSNRCRLAPTQGNLNTLVVRVNALDSVPPPASDLSEDIFGQYASCSYNKLTIEEYVPGNGISTVLTATNAPGVVDVFVNTNAVGNVRQQLQVDANAAARELFEVTDLNSLFDLVIFVSRAYFF